MLTASRGFIQVQNYVLLQNTSLVVYKYTFIYLFKNDRDSLIF